MSRWLRRCSSVSKPLHPLQDYAFVLLGQLCRRLEGMSHGERGYMRSIGSSLIRLPAQYRLYGRFHACTSSTAQVALRETSKYCGRKGNMHHLPAFPFAREPIRGCAVQPRIEHWALRLRTGIRNLPEPLELPQVLYALMPRWLLFAVQRRVHHPSAYPLSPDFPRLHQNQWSHGLSTPGLWPSTCSKTRDKYLHIDAARI